MISIISLVLLLITIIITIQHIIINVIIVMMMMMMMMIVCVCSRTLSEHWASLSGTDRTPFETNNNLYRTHSCNI